MEEPTRPVPEISIYGGTFSPPHNGHVNAVNEILSKLSPDRLYIVPTAIPPHKEISPLDDPMKRAEMVKLAFSDHPEFQKRLFISTVELRRGGKSYTADTLSHFRGEGNLTLCCGTDMFLSLDKWYHPERIFSLARIALIDRYRQTPELHEQIAEKSEFYRQHFGARLFFPKVNVVDLSSTDIRAAISAGEDVSASVPAAVLEYIKENGLYENAE